MTDTNTTSETTEQKRLAALLADAPCLSPVVAGEHCNDNRHVVHPLCAAAVLTASSHPRFNQLYARYPESRSDIRYEPARTLLIDGHEVYWLQWWVPFGGDKNNIHTGFQLSCECKFTEGVGYKVDENGRVSGLVGGDRCKYTEAALALRALELQEQYPEVNTSNWSPNHRPIDEIRLDVIQELRQRAKKGEWVCNRDSEMVYLQSLARVIGTSMSTMWELATLAQQRGLFSVYGAFLKDWEPKAELNYSVWKTWDETTYGHYAEAHTPSDPDSSNSIFIYVYKDKDKKEPAFVAPFPAEIHALGEIGGGWQWGWEADVEHRVQELFDLLVRHRKKEEFERNPQISE